MHNKFHKSWLFIVSFSLLIFIAACSQSNPYALQTKTISISQVNTAAVIIREATANAKIARTQTANIQSGKTKTPYKTPNINQTPSKTRIPYKTRTPSPTKTPWPAPWGPPAQIVASMPESIPCVAWEVTGCRWDFSVTFSVENDIGATVERIRRRYFSSKGGGPYTSWGGSGWGDILKIISPYGTYKYSSWVRTKTNPDLKGGRVEITYEGHDDHGNPFSGELSATLAAP